MNFWKLFEIGILVLNHLALFTMKAFSDCGHLLTGPSGEALFAMEALTHISSVSIQRNMD